MSAAPLFDVVVHRSGRENHVLRLGNDEHEPRGLRDPLHRDKTQGRRPRVLADEEEKLLEVAKDLKRAQSARPSKQGRLGALECLRAALRAQEIEADSKNPVLTVRVVPYDSVNQNVEQCAYTLAYAREASELGISAAGLLSQACEAERAVRGLEKLTVPFDMESVMRRDPRRLDLPPEGWEALDVLSKIIHYVPRALDCPRVRYGLRWLQNARCVRAENAVPNELKRLLRRIGESVAKPPKDKGKGPWWEPVTERERAILRAWSERERLNQEERERRAEALGFRSEPGEGIDAWDSLSRTVRRWRADKNS